MNQPGLLLKYSLILAIALVVAACSHTPAQVVEKSSAPHAEVPVDGLHRVHRGDTLHGIAFKYGLDFRAIASWNGIRSPYTIFPDQIIRLRPRPGASGKRTASAGNTGSGSRSSTKTVTQSAPPPSSSSRTLSQPKTVPAQQAKTVSSKEPGKWIWPTNGRLLRSYKSGDPARNGVDIIGREGQAVVASASGQVVYSGNGLIGYGELVIIKHSDRMLSAYAHNRKRLVDEGDTISQGRKIAELGRNDRDEQVLHFEIRRDGKPVNPMNYLPKK